MLLQETEDRGLSRAAERLRLQIESSMFDTLSGPVRVTVSVGATALSAADESFESALNRADQALYSAKRNGRNRVELRGC